MSAFKPLDFGRHLDQDDTLDVYEYAVLNALARGADNKTRKVRRSLTAIALAAKVKRHTVSDVLERPHVAKYLAKVDRHPRRVDIWLRPAPQGRAAAIQDDQPDDSHGRGAAKVWPSGGQGTAAGRPPSALSAPSALTKTAPAKEEIEEVAWALLADGEPGSLLTVAAGAQPPAPTGFGPESDPFRSSRARIPHPREATYSRNAFERMAREEGFDPITGEYGTAE